MDGYATGGSGMHIKDALDDDCWRERVVEGVDDVCSSDYGGSHRWAIERAVASDYKQDRLYAEHGIMLERRAHEH